MKTNVQTQSGNRVRVLIDGIVVGLMQSLRASDSYGHEKASGIGDIHVQEHVPTTATHTLNVSFMVLKRKNLRQQKLAPANGDDALKGNVFDIEVLDKDTNTIVRKYINCTYDTGELDVTKHQILMTSGTFLATDVTGAEM